MLHIILPRTLYFNMAIRQCDSSADQAYFATPDINAGMYDGTSQSSASSPLNHNVRTNTLLQLKSTNTVLKELESLYGASSFMPYPAFPMQYPMNGEDLAPIGLIPVQLNIEGLCRTIISGRRIETKPMNIRYVI